MKLMEHKTANYKSPFKSRLKGSMPAFEKRPSEQAHSLLEMNRLNIYINKLQDRLASLPVEFTHKGCRYRNLKRRLDVFMERKAKFLEKRANFFLKKKRKKSRREM